MYTSVLPIKKLIETLLTIKKDTYRKSYLKTLYELLECSFRERELPYYYFAHLLFKENDRNYKDYIGLRKLLKIKKEVFRHNDVLRNKLLFQKFMQENNIPVPALLAQVEGGHLSSNGFSEELTSPVRLVHLLENLLNVYTASYAIFIKPSDGTGGKGIYKINKYSLLDGEKVSNLFTDLKKCNYIIQEAVLQHEEMSKLNSSSLNTMRIISYRDSNGRIGIASASNRIGCGGSDVDNASLGGIFIPIDIVNGCLCKYGYNFLKEGGKTFTSHPDTGILFDGFKIPYFQESLNLACDAASLIQNPIVGWDIAVLKDGPIIIEGNHNPHLIYTQITCGGFRSHPVYQKIFAKYL